MLLTICFFVVLPVLLLIYKIAGALLMNRVHVMDHYYVHKIKMNRRYILLACLTHTIPSCGILHRMVRSLLLMKQCRCLVTTELPILQWARCAV